METRQDRVEEDISEIKEKLEALPEKITSNVLTGLSKELDLYQTRCANTRAKEYTEIQIKTLAQAKKELEHEIPAMVAQRVEEARPPKKDWGNIHYTLALALAGLMTMAVMAYRGEEPRKAEPPKPVTVTHPALPTP